MPIKDIKKRKEFFKKYLKEYYLKNKDKINKQHKQYRLENKKNQEENKYIINYNRNQEIEKIRNQLKEFFYDVNY